MFKPHKNCNICKVILKGDEKLARRIMSSKKWVLGGESLGAIAKDYEGKFSYQSLCAHAKKHQAPTEEDLIKSRVNRKQAEIVTQRFQKQVRSVDVRQDLMDRLAQKLESGDFDDSMTVKDLIKVLKDTDDVAAKKKDQDLDILKMMLPYQSGEIETLNPSTMQRFEAFDPWAEVIEGEVVRGVDGTDSA